MQDERVTFFKSANDGLQGFFGEFILPHFGVNECQVAPIICILRIPLQFL